MYETQEQLTRDLDSLEESDLEGGLSRISFGNKRSTMVNGRTDRPNGEWVVPDMGGSMD